MRRFPLFARLLLLSLLPALLATAPGRSARAWSDQPYPRGPAPVHNDERWRHDHPQGLVFPPIVLAPLGGPPTVPAPTGFWYRCDNPAGYYPFVGTCRSRWRTVAARPVR
jgi:hypothetical protein